MRSLQIMPGSVALASVLIWLGCSNGGPKESPMVTVQVPAGGSQGSNTAGTAAAGSGGAAGSAGMAATDPPHVGPPAPEDASTPAMLDAALDAGMDDDDAGPWVPPEPTCVDGLWRLAPGFLVARHVDFVADRNSLLPDAGGFALGEPPTLSSAGMACANARDKEKCRTALAQPNQFGRHLITTEGDSVRVWAGASGRALLGLLDTPSDALWYLTANGPYLAPCTAKISPSDGGYTVEGVQPIEGCFTPGEIPPKLTVFVGSVDGAMREIAATPDAGHSLCGTF
ncbi:MAG TPA: hypothetical protein VFG30_36625 [Polyangiales bacterium]|nr:hypothetical protein [Polyangiales bacterium]